MTRYTAQFVSRVVIAVIAVAAMAALMLAASIAREIVDDPGQVELRLILRGAAIAAVFVVIALMMTSNLVRKSKLRG